MIGRFKYSFVLIVIFLVLLVGYFYGRNSSEVSNLVNNIQVSPQSSVQKSPDPTYELQVKKVEGEGYTPVDFEPSDTSSFRVIVGAATGSAGGYGRRAFFFNNDNYIGVDATSPSAIVNTAWRYDKVIALEYVLYKKDEPMCCPTGGSNIVRFEWDGTKLITLDPIPTDGWDEKLSRR